jgi:hypothetical protein
MLLYECGQCGKQKQAPPAKEAPRCHGAMYIVISEGRQVTSIKKKLEEPEVHHEVE